MKATDIVQPTPMTSAIAANGSKDNIPQEQSSATDTWYCSVEKGFPDITMKPMDEGGYPPRGQGANGLFYIASDQKVYLQNGGSITFDQDVSDAIGGYPQGAVLDYIDGGNFNKVISLIDDNTYNFVNDPTYINGTYWQKLLFSGDDYANINLSNLTATGENHFTNKDLSNLTSTGQKVLDGQWVSSGLTIVTGRNSQTTTDLEYSLSSYLPSDSYKYEVIFSMIGSTATAVGSTQRGLLSTDILRSSTWRVYIAENETSRTIEAGGSAILPVGTNRKVIVKAHASNTGTFNLYALGYRRIGTNS